MGNRKDCLTCFYQGTNLGSFPCVQCSAFSLWTDKDAYKEEDPVSKPKHYNVGIEPIEAIESWGLNFRLANVIKYVARADHKNNRLEDLKKARWYLDREISKHESDI